MNDAAARLGLRAGMALADAKAMYPALTVMDADPQADRILLAAIADWCDRYTPLVGLDPPDGLMLDITRLRASVRRRGGASAATSCSGSRRQGFAARIAIADTVGCAWAVARYRREPQTRMRFRQRPARSRSHRCRWRRLRLAPDIAAALGPGRSQAHRRRDRSAARAARGAFRRRNSSAASIRRSAARTSRSARACRFRPMWRSGASPSRSRSKPTCSAPSSGWRTSSPACWSGAAKAPAGCRSRCSAPTARFIAARSGPARRCAIRGASGRCSASGWPRSARPAIPVSASMWCGCRRWRPSAAIRCRPAWRRPTTSAELAHLVDRLGARFGLRRVTRPVPQDSHIPEFAVAAVPAQYRARESRRRWQSASALSRRTSRHLSAAAAAASVRSPGADRGDRGSAGRSAGALSLAARAARGRPCRRPRAHRHGMVARPEGPRADARLFPRREPRGRARLALSRRPLWTRADEPRWFLHGLFA